MDAPSTPAEAAYLRSVSSAPKTSPLPDEEPLQEIVVTARPIPWWLWLLAGATVAFLVGEFSKKR